MNVIRIKSFFFSFPLLFVNSLFLEALAAGPLHLLPFQFPLPSFPLGDAFRLALSPSETIPDFLFL